MPKRKLWRDISKRHFRRLIRNEFLNRKVPSSIAIAGTSASENAVRHISSDNDSEEAFDLLAASDNSCHSSEYVSTLQNPEVTDPAPSATPNMQLNSRLKDDRKYYESLV